MIVQFTYKPFMGTRKHYSGKLLNPKVGLVNTTFDVELPKGKASFRLDRVVPEDRSYMQHCIETEIQYLETLARIRYRNLIRGNTGLGIVLRPKYRY